MFLKIERGRVPPQMPLNQECITSIPEMQKAENPYLDNRNRLVLLSYIISCNNLQAD